MAKGGQFLPRLAAVLLTCWAMALITPELTRLSHPLSSFGLSANNNGLIIGVTDPFSSADQSPAALAGLLPGDRIDLTRMNCRDFRSAACASIMPVLGDDGEVAYAPDNFTAVLDILTGPEATPHSITLTAVPAPLEWLDKIILVAGTVAGILIIAAAFLLVWTRPGRMSWGFFLFSIWFNPGQDYTYYAWLQPWPLAVLTEQFWEAIVQGAAYAGLLGFAIRFPTGGITPGWRKVERLLPAVSIIVSVFTAVCAGNLFGIPTETLNDIVFCAGFVIDGGAIVILLLRLPSLPPQDEQRMLWAIAGCTIGIPAFLIAEICVSTSIPADIFGFTPPLSVSGLLFLLQGFMTYFVGTAIYRRRVISVAIPLRRSATLTFLTFLLGVPILYLHDLITQYTERKDMPSWIWPLILGPIVLVFLARLQDFAAVYSERIFSRRYHRARLHLRDAGRALRHAGSFDEIDRVLAEAPGVALRLASVAVFRMVGNRLYRVGPAIGWTDADAHELDPAQYPTFFAQLLGEHPIRLPRSQWDRPGVPRDDLYPCLAVPLRGGVTESIAVIFCGPHVTGADISYDECELLRGFVARAALSYDRVEANLLRQEVLQLRSALEQYQGAANAPP